MTKLNKNTIIIATICLILLGIGVYYLPKLSSLSILNEGYENYAEFTGLGTNCTHTFIDRIAGSKQICENDKWRWEFPRSCEGYDWPELATNTQGVPYPACSMTQRKVIMPYSSTFEIMFSDSDINLINHYSIRSTFPTYTSNNYVGSTTVYTGGWFDSQFDLSDDMIFQATENFYGDNLVIDMYMERPVFYTRAGDYYFYESAPFLFTVGDKSFNLLDMNTVVPQGGYNTPVVNKNYILKLISHPENPKLVDFYFNDNLVETITLLSDELKPKFEVWQSGNNVHKITSFQVKRACTGNMQVDEIFKGSQLVKLDSLRFDNVKFCSSLLSEKISGQTLYKDELINQILQSGQGYQINDGEVLKIRYYTDYQGQFDIACTDDNVFSYCQDASGFVTLCSEGAWDNSQGACSTLTTSVPFCVAEVDDHGLIGRVYGRYDTENKSCYYNNPQGDICVKGTYNSIRGVCVWEPDCGRFIFNPVQGECCGSELQSFNPISGQCEEFADLPDECTSNLMCADGIKVKKVCANGQYGPEQSCTVTNVTVDDTDGDSIPNNIDNCPLASNINQIDTDNDGIGDICEQKKPEPTNIYIYAGILSFLFVLFMIVKFGKNLF